MKTDIQSAFSVLEERISNLSGKMNAYDIIISYSIAYASALDENFKSSLKSYISGTVIDFDQMINSRTESAAFKKSISVSKSELENFLNKIENNSRRFTLIDGGIKD